MNAVAAAPANGKPSITSLHPLGILLLFARSGPVTLGFLFDMDWIVQIDASSRRQYLPQTHQGFVKTQLELDLAFYSLKIEDCLRLKNESQCPYQLFE
jgi:hypothetical protein